MGTTGPGLEVLLGRLRGLRHRATRLRWRHSSPAEVFTEIDATGHYAVPEGRSGAGSTLARTEGLRARLAELFARLGIRSLLDAPCGDGIWMSRLPLDGIAYHGVDIVPALVELHRSRGAPGARTYARADILAGPLPRADLILSRDFMIHLSDAHIRAALASFRASGSRFLLTSSFPGHLENRDIVTGDFRAVNLELPPFRFPPPDLALCEECPTPGYEDKVLALWRLDQLPGGAA